MNERVAFFRLDESAEVKSAPRLVDAAAPARSRVSVAPKGRPMAPPKRPLAVAPARRGPVGRMQTALATAFQDDADVDAAELKRTAKNLEEAIQKHAEWKVKLRSAISNEEQLDAETISKDNCCELGKWLHGDGKSKHGQMTEFQSLIEKHKVFHTEAGKISQLINAKKYAEAERALNAESAYAGASSAVTAAVMAVKSAVAKALKEDPDWKEF
jgi:hypothetical protein